MGVLLDGSSDYYLRGGDLTGAVDSKSGITSFWLKLSPGSDGNSLYVLQGTADAFYVLRTNVNAMRFVAKNVATSNRVFLVSSAVAVEAGGWKHYLASWDVATGASHLYVDDVSDLASETNINDALNYTTDEASIGATTIGTNKLDGVLSELYFAPGQYLDFSVEANRRKFITAEGTPANLGADGSLPTGTAPLIYCAGGKDAFPANYGTGGSFSAVGAPTTIPFAAPEDTRARTRHRLGADYYR